MSSSSGTFLTHQQISTSSQLRHHNHRDSLFSLSSRKVRRRRSTIILVLLGVSIVGVVIRQTRLAVISTQQQQEEDNILPKVTSSTRLSSLSLSWSINSHATNETDLPKEDINNKNNNTPRNKNKENNNQEGADNDDNDNGDSSSSSSSSMIVAPILPLRNQNDDDTSFSACLLVMDDNHFLIEWIAYHYHILPLRYLVVAVDPRSRTSPKLILDKWDDSSSSTSSTSSYSSNLTIARWNDKHFMPKKWLPKNRKPMNENDSTSKFILHRERQRHFYPACLTSLRNANRSWTMIIDIDEYVVQNHHYLYYNETTTTTKKILPILPPSPIVSTTTTTTTTKAQQSLQSQSQQELQQSQQQPQPITTLIQAIRHPNKYYNYTDTACITMPRLRFGAFKDNNTIITNTTTTTTTTNRYAPSGFQDDNFMTLQWHWRSGLHNRKENRNPKSMIDLSLLSNITFSRQDTDAHRPVRSVCPKRNMYILNQNSPFVVHHYTGTIEQYQFRKDARDGLKQRNQQRYIEYQQIHDTYDDTICTWIQSFVQTYGYKQSKFWLEGVGNVSYTPLPVKSLPLSPRRRPPPPPPP